MIAISVFGTEVVYDCPNHLLMQQKKFMKVKSLQSRKESFNSEIVRIIYRKFHSVCTDNYQ